VAGLIAGLIVKMGELPKNNLREVLAISGFNSHSERKSIREMRR